MEKWWFRDEAVWDEFCRETHKLLIAAADIHDARATGGTIGSWLTSPALVEEAASLRAAICREISDTLNVLAEIAAEGKGR